MIGGIALSDEIVIWADAWIMRLDERSDALIEVSLSKARQNEMLTALGELADPNLSQEAFSLLCRLLVAFLRVHPDGLRTVTRLLALLAIENALPDDLMGEAARLDDALSLADERIFDPLDVRQEILGFLVQHAGGTFPHWML